MQSEHPPPQTAGIRRQYHMTHLALKHGLSRAVARKVLVAAGASRAKADEIALAIAGKRTPRPVDEATHGSGNRDADHDVGSDEQKLRNGVKPAVQPKRTPSDYRRSITMAAESSDLE